MIQFLLAAAPAFLDAGMAAFGASQENQAAQAQQDAQVAQAQAQMRLNQQAANDEWYGQQVNYNNQVEQAALKHVEILKKRVQAEGSFGAQEGQSGKTAKRRRTILATGAAGFDMAALNKSTEAAKEATINKAIDTARTLDQRNIAAAGKVQPYVQKSVFGAAAMSLGMSAAKAGIGALAGQFANPMGKAKDAAGAAKAVDYAGGAAETGAFTDKLTGLSGVNPYTMKFEPGTDLLGNNFLGNSLLNSDFSMNFSPQDLLKIRR